MDLLRAVPALGRRSFLGAFTGIFAAPAPQPPPFDVDALVAAAVQGERDRVRAERLEKRRLILVEHLAALEATRATMTGGDWSADNPDAVRILGVLDGIIEVDRRALAGITSGRGIR
jgi:hypothetical protein